MRFVVLAAFVLLPSLAAQQPSGLLACCERFTGFDLVRVGRQDAAQTLGRSLEDASDFERACRELLGELAANRPAPVRAHWPLRLAGKVLQWTRLDRFAPDQMALLHDLTRQVTYDCSGALELLAHAGVVCPPFEAYADVLVGWVADYERSLRNEPDHMAGA